MLIIFLASVKIIALSACIAPMHTLLNNEFYLNESSMVEEFLKFWSLMYIFKMP